MGGDGVREAYGLRLRGNAPPRILETERKVTVAHAPGGLEFSN
jgi:hypothetical protein